MVFWDIYIFVKARSSNEKKNKIQFKIVYLFMCKIVQHLIHYFHI